MSDNNVKLDPKGIEAAAQTLVFVSAAHFHERGSGVKFLPNDEARAAASGAIAAYLSTITTEAASAAAQTGRIQWPDQDEIDAAANPEHTK